MLEYGSGKRYSFAQPVGALCSQCRSNAEERKCVFCGPDAGYSYSSLHKRCAVCGRYFCSPHHGDEVLGLCRDHWRKCSFCEEPNFNTEVRCRDCNMFFCRRHGDEEAGLCHGCRRKRNSLGYILGTFLRRLFS